MVRNPNTSHGPISGGHARHAGCETLSILDALDLEWSHLYRPEQHDSILRHTSKGQSADDYPPVWKWEKLGLLESVYPYLDQDGKLLYEIFRSKDKVFRPRTPDSTKKGGYRYNLVEVPRVLYRLPAVLEAVKSNQLVFVVEGEKDANRLAELGLIATTWPGGADKSGKKWQTGYTNSLRGARVAVLSDNDEVGLFMAKVIATELCAVSNDVKLVPLPGLNTKEDVSDWLNHGGTVGKLSELVAATDQYVPQPLKAKQRFVTNFKWSNDDESGTRKRRALRIKEMSSRLFDLTKGWPRRIGEMLFVVEEGKIRFLGKVESFFAWLGEIATIRWKKGDSSIGENTFTPKTEFFSHITAKAQNYLQVEELPHEPPIEGFFTSWKPPQDYDPDGSHLETLLKYFDNTESIHDEALIRAMFLTPLWGGLPGTRPAFVIMAPDRGCGKSTLSDVLGELYGCLEVEPGRSNDDKLMGRLLTPSALTSRVVRVDNLKGRMSSAQIEALITYTTISGHRLYCGESSRPNTLTWVLTGNALQLSRDLSDRSFIIRLKKPKSRQNWREELFNYVRDNKDKIVADVIHALSRRPMCTKSQDRWQSWVDNVLSRSTPDAETVVKVNQVRRDGCDEDLEEAETLRDEILKSVHWKESEGFVTSTEMTRIVNDALNTHYKTPSVAAVLKGHMEAGRLSLLKKIRKSHANGYEIREGNGGRGGS